jgi:hypothetical protein
MFAGVKHLSAKSFSRPVDDSDSPEVVFGKSGAAFYPVAGVTVEKIADGVQRCVVNVAAYHPINPIFDHFCAEDGFKTADIVYRHLAAVLDLGRERGG